MSNQINYKQKYQELKMKFMESVDSAFRMGVEQGLQQAEKNQMMQQQQAAEQAAQAQSGAPGQEGQGSQGSPAGAEQMANPNGGTDGAVETQNPAGSELDQHIEKLESMIAKSDSEGLDLGALEKTVSTIKNLRKSIAFEIEMKKSALAIPAIAKALHKPSFKVGQVASHNMNDNAKRAVGMQHKIVEDIMKSWQEEESKASKDITSILKLDGLAKKE